MPTTTDQCKHQVLQYAQRGYQQSLMAGTSGNLSALCSDNKLVITPSGYDYMKMTTHDIMVIDLEGNILEGKHRPSSEWPMHAYIYKHMPEVRAVVHTHSPYATAFSVINQPVPLALVEMVFFIGGDIPVAPLATQGTVEVGQGVVKALAGRGACLMQNHGAVSIGKDLAQAYLRTEYAEDAAKICHMAKSIGTPTIIPNAMVQEMLNR